MILWQYGFVKLNGTIVFTWGVMLALAIGARLITRRLSTGLDRTRWQNLLEIVVTGIAKQIEDVGFRQPEKYFGFLGTLFLFIAAANLTTVLPGYEPPTGSLSTTAALALSVFVAVPNFGIEARKERDEFQRKNNELEEQRRAVAPGGQRRQRTRLFEEAQSAADAFVARRQVALKNDARNLNHAITHRVRRKYSRSRKGARGSRRNEPRRAYGRDLRPPAPRFERRCQGKASKGRVVEQPCDRFEPRSTCRAHSAIAEAAIKDTLSSEAQVRFETAPG